MYTFKMLGNKINAAGTGNGIEPNLFYVLGANQNNSFENNDVFVGSGNVISSQSRHTIFATFQNYKLSGNTWSTDNNDGLRFLVLNLTGTSSSISGDKFTTPDFIIYLSTKKSIVDTINAQKNQEAWIVPTLTGAWTAVNTVAYRKN